MSLETHGNRQARQRASVKWLLSKAFNNYVPDNLKEPFYRDHENQERLKPQIIVELANSVLYCQTLSNLYKDPNYHNLNHWSIIQMLARKGFPVTDVTDMAVTETVLTQTNPLKLNAHVSVIESLMLLYAKEVLSGDRLASVIRRISDSTHQTAANQSIEQSLLAWITYICEAKKKIILTEIEEAKDKNNVALQAPNISNLGDIQELCDGVCIALLISYYCPNAIPWTSVRIRNTKDLEDSMHNMLLISNFAQIYLPYNVYHMHPDDVTFMGGSLKLNIIMLLVDLFILFEINPAKCVSYRSIAVQDDLASPFFTCPTEDRSNKEGFVVTKSRAVTTLSSMKPRKDELLHPAHLRQSKEKSFIESKDDEKGRRSRRNSSSEDSQLTIENFGGSQDQLYYFGYLDRQSEQESHRNQSIGSIEPVVALRSSVMDVRGTLQLGYDTDSGSEKQDRDTEKCSLSGKENYCISNKVVMHPSSEHSTVAYTNKSVPLSKNYYTFRPEYLSDNLFDSKTNFYENDETTMTDFTKRQSNNDCYDTKSLDNAPEQSGMHMQLQDKLRYINQDKIKIERTASLHYREKEKVFDPHPPHAPNVHNLTMQHQYGYGSTPYLPQMFNMSDDIMNSRPVNYQGRYQQHQHHILPFKSIDDKSNYILSQHQQQQQQQPLSNHHSQHPHMQSLYIENAAPSNVQNHSEPQLTSHMVQKQLNMQSVGNDDYAQFQNAHDTTLQPNTYNSYQASSPFQRYAWKQPSFEQMQQHQQQQQQQHQHQQQHQQQQQQQHQQQQQQLPLVDIKAWESQNNLYMGYNHRDSRENQFPPKANFNQGFVLHENGGGVSDQHLYHVQLAAQSAHSGSMGNIHQQHPRSVQDKHTLSSAVHQPSDDVMTPQSICFIGDEGDVEEIERNIVESLQGAHISNNMQPYRQHGISLEDYNSNEMHSQKLNISSGNLTFRVPLPSRPPLQPNSFQDPQEVNKIDQKGFYISFDEKDFERSKPTPRSRISLKNVNSVESLTAVDDASSHSKMHTESENNAGFYGTKDLKPSGTQSRNSQMDQWIDHRKVKTECYNEQPKQENYVSSSDLTKPPQSNDQPHHPKDNIIVGTEDSNLDPKLFEEMERRKEKIWLLSLQRRQQQEEVKARKDLEAAQKRDRERYKEEERARKRNEQAARRAVILEQHRLKKAIEEAEREGKTFDGVDMPLNQPFKNSPAPRLRSQKMIRPRPNTIHVDDRSIMSETSNISSREGKGSSGNLTESPDEYASTRSTPTTRRGSFKTHRGPRLYKQPTAKSNRGIILNAVEYCVFPGAVNHEAKKKVLEKIARSDATHFLVLFRDAGCQFRALYSYSPETNQVCKLYGTGPSQVDEVMFDKFFKYNSGGKCFSQVHTKHLTVTIDAFTIHNSLWQGKKINLSNKKNMSLVI